MSGAPLALLASLLWGTADFLAGRASRAHPAVMVAFIGQATGLLWTARRAAGRAMSRLPMEPTWDTTGMRMELVR